MTTDGSMDAALEVGPRSIEAYSRLSYTMWHALAEFIDNSTQSRLNYSGIIEDVLSAEGRPLTVEITYNRLEKTITIEDNSIGMTRERLVDALRIAHPTKDSTGRSRYGMGMKTAAFWLGSKWQVVTTQWGSTEEWTAAVDLAHVVAGRRVPLTRQDVSEDAHYTKLVISDLHRFIQKRTEETIINFLGSMYRFDLAVGTLKLLFNGVEVRPPEDLDFDTDPGGAIMRREIAEVKINGKTVRGWVAVLRKGGRKFGGFSLFQEQRQIQGYPNAWKPRNIFGGEYEEGANNLISQRLTGLIEFDRAFKVSHTKDAILFEGDEEDEVEKLLEAATKDYRNYATKRRNNAGTPWAREKVRDLLDSMRKEFGSTELQDRLRNAPLPPLDTIVKNNQNQIDSLTGPDVLESYQIGEVQVIVAMQERSEHDPYLTIASGAAPGTIYVIVNGLHPYYSSIEATDAQEECLRQFIYDAIAEYRVSKLASRVVPDSVRRMKSDLLRAPIARVESIAANEQKGDADDHVSAAAS